MKQFLSNSFFSLSLLFLIVGCSDDNGGETQPLNDLETEIDVSSVSFISDNRAIDGRRIKANQSITLMAETNGDPDEFLWEFGGGLPDASGETVTVSWPDEVGRIYVILTASRSTDSSISKDTLELQVGPVEILNQDIFGFEADNALEKWNTWSITSNADGGDWSGDDRVSFSIETAEGANGTSRSAKIVRNYRPAQDGSTAWMQLSTWQNNVGGNAILESNTTYIFSYYVKSSSATSINDSNFLNRGGAEGSQQDWKDFGAYQFEVEIGTDWEKKSFEFSTDDLSQYATYEDGTANNASPFFQVNPPNNTQGDVTIWIDQVSLKKKEQ